MVALPTPAYHTPIIPRRFVVDGVLVPVVTDDEDRAGALLSEWDDYLAELDQALKDAAAARELLADADRRAVVARERAGLVRAALRLEAARR